MRRRLLLLLFLLLMWRRRRAHTNTQTFTRTSCCAFAQSSTILRRTLDNTVTFSRRSCPCRRCHCRWRPSAAMCVRRSYVARARRQLLLLLPSFCSSFFFTLVSLLSANTPSNQAGRQATDRPRTLTQSHTLFFRFILFGSAIGLNVRGPNKVYFQWGNTIKVFRSYLAIKHNDFIFRVCIICERIYGF